MPSQTPRVVVVDDDPSMRQALERILRAGGFEPLVFSSAEDAIDAGAGDEADCFVFDVFLPGLGGFDLCRRLAGSDTATPVIFITARDEPAVRAEAEKLGATAYLPKPFAGRTLLNAVTDALNPH
jgi:FixJ family two-component response regulator